MKLSKLHPVIVLHVNATRALELRDQLVDAGLMQDQDFIWEYRQATYNNDGFSAVTPRQVKFEFVDPTMATFYRLKWSADQ